jgi:hypothetical protein
MTPQRLTHLSTGMPLCSQGQPGASVDATGRYCTTRDPLHTIVGRRSDRRRDHRKRVALYWNVRPSNVVPQWTSWPRTSVRTWTMPSCMPSWCAHWCERSRGGLERDTPEVSDATITAARSRTRSARACEPEPEDGGVRENGTDASGRGGLDTAGRPACVKGTVAMPAATRTPPSVLWICLACMTADGYDVVSYGAVLPIRCSPTPAGG